MARHTIGVLGTNSNSELIGFIRIILSVGLRISEGELHARLRIHRPRRTLPWNPLFSRRKRRERLMRFRLVPVGERGDIIGERLEVSVWPPSTRPWVHRPGALSLQRSWRGVGICAAASSVRKDRVRTLRADRYRSRHR